MKTFIGVGLVTFLFMAFGAGCSSSDSGGAVDRTAYCNKCAACYAEDPGFQEGFCDPFWNGTTFDKGACVKNADAAALDTKPSAAELSSMSCTDFDNAV